MYLDVSLLNPARENMKSPKSLPVLSWVEDAAPAWARMRDCTSGARILAACRQRLGENWGVDPDHMYLPQLGRKTYIQQGLVSSVCKKKRCIQGGVLRSLSVENPKVLRE